MSRYGADLARTAKRLIERYGADASREAGKRADNWRKAGKRHLEVKWLTVLMIVEETRRGQHRERRVRPHVRALFSRLRLHARRVARRVSPTTAGR